LCDFYNSSDHNINLCSYYTCYAEPDFVSPWDKTEVVLTLHDSSFPLAQCTGLADADPFGVVARSSAVDACFESDDTFDKVHDLVKTPLEGSRNVFVYKNIPSVVCNNVLPNPLDHSYVSPMCSQPSISPEYSLDVPINNLKICDSNVDLGYEVKVFKMLDGNVDNFFP